MSIIDKAQCLYRFAVTNLLKGSYTVTMKEGQRSIVEVQALVGNGSEAFLNINFTTTKGSVATVDISVYR
jgi:hypothetical protein